MASPKTPPAVLLLVLVLGLALLLADDVAGQQQATASTCEACKKECDGSCAARAAEGCSGALGPCGSASVFPASACDACKKFSFDACSGGCPASCALRCPQQCRRCSEACLAGCDAIPASACKRYCNGGSTPESCSGCTTAASVGVASCRLGCPAKCAIELGCSPL